MSPDKLVMMANQIGAFFASQGPGGAKGAADHIRSFWDPRMQARILDHLDKGGEGLTPLVVQALSMLRSKP
ncbi:formate dehydrogenase [Niveispirillum lacus]|uniref:Formate dehydrogenase n=1 Tax=Niveispirillum lacus TaxID=1981099 RepID=A0A255YYJ8_9PROT|nr:formate dehydrogenase subunit delta [Niveispirillum lacus]OYQ34241.1 formate dehydrogenase [Niveispirillum lacus]